VSCPFFIMFFIIITTAATLHAKGIINVETASQAAEALRPVVGNLAYLSFAASTLIGMLINWLEIDPIKVLYYAAALNGLAAPQLIVLILLIANNKKIMGRFVNKRISNILGWTIALVMAIAGLLYILNLLKNSLHLPF